MCLVAGTVSTKQRFPLKAVRARAPPRLTRGFYIARERAWQPPSADCGDACRMFERRASANLRGQRTGLDESGIGLHASNWRRTRAICASYRYVHFSNALARLLLNVALRCVSLCLEGGMAMAMVTGTATHRLPALLHRYPLNCLTHHSTETTLLLLFLQSKCCSLHIRLALLLVLHCTAGLLPLL